jgi:hypothetical protein
MLVARLHQQTVVSVHRLQGMCAYDKAGAKSEIIDTVARAMLYVSIRGIRALTIAQASHASLRSRSRAEVFRSEKAWLIYAYGV